jgi:hypothetical protein
MFITFLGRATLNLFEILMCYACLELFMNNMFCKINNVLNKKLCNKPIIKCIILGPKYYLRHRRLLEPLKGSKYVQKLFETMYC